MSKIIILLICFILCISKKNASDLIDKNYKAIACLSLSRNALAYEKVNYKCHPEINSRRIL